MNVAQPPFDVFFFSCGESYAAENLARLRELCPQAQHIANVPTTPGAWRAAAERSRTSHFFSVDADNLVEPTFRWEVPGFEAGDPRVHVWRSRNAVNHLEYGHGAIKLWSAERILWDQRQGSTPSVDFTCHMARFGFLVQPETASVTHFNATAEEAWKGAFKECLKLATGATRYAGTFADPEQWPRLLAWAALGRDAEQGIYSLLGARKAIALALRAPHEATEAYGPKRRDELWRSIRDPEAELAESREDLAGLGFLVPELNAESSAEVKKSGNVQNWARKFSPRPSALGIGSPP